MQEKKEIMRRHRLIVLIGFPLGGIIAFLFAIDTIKDGIQGQSGLTFLFSIELFILAVIVFFKPDFIPNLSLIFSYSTVIFLFWLTISNINIAYHDSTYGRHFIGDSLNGLMGWITIIFIFTYLSLSRKKNFIFTIATFGGLLAIATYHFMYLGTFEISYYISRWLNTIIGVGTAILLINRIGNLQTHYATYDSLTGLLNRKAITQLLEQEMGRSERYNRPLSIIIYDIDHFKNINDTYGHPSGDEVLKSMSDLVNKTIRKEDFLGRWGGEEFLILLPDTGKESAKFLAERVRVAIEEYQFEKVKHLTASFGVATNQIGWTQENLLLYTDNALYEAKHSGRNRVTSYCANQKL
ncbi:MAG: diguanylate cyclase [Anaerolineae bacterium]|jgi:diguanylate cyclase (GGDEF)-like protein|nr:diguanylate cyclase [Anaerolineae bacterium]MBT6814248.1 diguanylate cyclase [Anaerolineae bacterium]MBT7483459.1 diguanylate cyclase [Candidatus Peregrinibacteria bacterium]MBT7599975.1 diguanylate cyclase [Anaerolineae bacterium]MBT7774478.1 diguanylate cyclase [Anaerolineae bacterium]